MHTDTNRSKIKITQKAATFIWVIGTIGFRYFYCTLSSEKKQ
nr:MAG TPA: hypothetical protein [Caudoviricetes sp.]